MTPAEHYREAERLISKADDDSTLFTADTLTCAELIALAQVHATLATISPHTHASPVKETP
jgi:hypothetical protein